MLSNLKLILIGLFVLAIIFLINGCASQPVFCPEVRVNFYPSR